MKADSLYVVNMLDGQIQAMLIDSTQLAERARAVHKLPPAAAVAMGKHLSVSAILGMMVPFDEPLNLSMDGVGPMWRLAAEVKNSGFVRGYATWPNDHMPGDGGPLPSGGRLTVFKDLKDGRRFQRQADVAADEMEKGYVRILEEHGAGPHYLSLGAVAEESVASCAGLLLSLMPGASREAGETLRRIVPAVRDIGRIMERMNLDEAVERFFGPLHPEVVGALYTRFFCDCSWRSIAKGLLEELGPALFECLIAGEDEHVRTCVYCKKEHRHTGEQAKKLLEEAGFG